MGVGFAEIAESFGKMIGEQMTDDTITLNEAEMQLRKLVEQTRATDRPVILTAEGTDKPLAVLIGSKAFEEAQRNQQRLFHLQRFELMYWLDRAQEKWDSPSIRQECVAVWQDSMKTLLDLSPAGVRGFCTALSLSVQQLTSERFSLAQVEALRYALEVMKNSEPDDATIQAAYHKLRDSHLSPRLIFDRELVQSYLDES